MSVMKSSFWVANIFAGLFRGSEKSPKEPLYYNGNDDEEKQGYGHIG